MYIYIYIIIFVYNISIYLFILGTNIWDFFGEHLLLFPQAAPLRSTAALPGLPGIAHHRGDGGGEDMSLQGQVGEASQGVPG